MDGGGEERTCTGWERKAPASARTALPVTRATRRRWVSRRAYAMGRRRAVPAWCAMGHSVAPLWACGAVRRGGTATGRQASQRC